MASEDCSRAPDYVTKQDHLPTKMAKRALISGRRAIILNYLTRGGYVYLFICGGGGESRYFTFQPMEESFLNSLHSR